MFGYLLHQSSLWPVSSTFSDGARNTRILIVALVFYIILHAFLFTYMKDYFFIELCYNYFFYFVAADVFACATLYKTYYGRTILKELNVQENDIYDEKTHTYLPGAAAKSEAIKINIALDKLFDIQPKKKPEDDKDFESNPNIVELSNSSKIELSITEHDAEQIIKDVTK